MAFLSARGVGDPALDWGGRALSAESERGPALKSIFLFRSLSRLGVFPPQSRVDTRGIACSTPLAEKPAFQPLTKASSSQGCLMSLRLPPPEGLTSRHIGAHPVCAVLRLIVSLVQPGSTQKEVLGSPNLPGAERQRGKEHVVERSDELKICRLMCCKIRALWRELDCPKPNS